MIGNALAWLARLISGARAFWLEPPDTPGQRVYFGNHSSHLDFIVIWSALSAEERRRTRPVAGADYWNRGAIRRYLADRVFNAILINRPATDRSAASASLSVAKIAEGMGQECSVIVFPEGTRSTDGEVQRFRSGLYHLCQLKPALDLVPVYLANMNRILPKGEVLPVPLLGRVIFGAAMRLHPDEDKEAFLERARSALLELKDK